MSLLPIVRNRLIATGVVETGWTCFIGYGPEEGDKQILLSPTGGFPQDTQQNENLQETFQVTIRAAQLDYEACEAKWTEVFEALTDADLSASGIRLIQALQSGPLVWYDDKNRPNMSVNFKVVRAR